VAPFFEGTLDDLRLFHADENVQGHDDESLLQTFVNVNQNLTLNWCYAQFSSFNPFSLTIPHRTVYRRTHV